MQNNFRSIGFLGTDSYDLIIYLAAFLQAMEKKVLLVDNSESRGLQYCIPSRQIQLEAGSLWSAQETYLAEETRGREIYGAEQGEPGEKEVNREEQETALEGYGAAPEEQESYDYVIFDFGQCTDNPLLAACNDIFLVTDTKLHNIINLKRNTRIHRDYYLLVREITGGVNEKYLPELLKDKGIMGRRHFFLYWDEEDREVMTELQYHHSFSYKRLSPGIQAFLKEVLEVILGFDKKETRLAEKRVRRGR